MDFAGQDKIIRWDIMFTPKYQAGLGIDNLEIKNKCLLSKWLSRLSVETNGMWSQILRNKYLQSKSLAQVTIRRNDSPFWKGLMYRSEVLGQRLNTRDELGFEMRWC